MMSSGACGRFNRIVRVSLILPTGAPQIATGRSEDVAQRQSGRVIGGLYPVLDLKSKRLSER